MRTSILLAVLLLSYVYARTEICLCPSWKFDKADHPNAADPKFDDSAWSDVNLPHTYNAKDGQEFGKYYRGVGWYRKHYTSDSSLVGKKLFLQFDGVSIITDVYLNGKKLGQHHGAYSIFRYDATYDWKHNAENIIAVKTNNSITNIELPLTADFTQFGGIYRRVRLIATEIVHFTLMDYGSLGLYVNQTKVAADLAVLDITAKVFNSNNTVPQKATVIVSIADKDTIIAQTNSTQVIHTHALLEYKLNIRINKPHLWNGRHDPFLYTVTAKVVVDSITTDVVTQKIGLRSFYIDREKGFILNGQSYRLHGTSMHQDRLDKGWAVSQEDLAQDMSFQDEIGATGMRLAHYQHDQIVYDLADELGIVVWAEIPFVDNVALNKDFYNNAQSLLTELIRQNFNHASIAFWSIANEVRAPPDATELFTILNKLVHKEDQTRISTEASCCIPETHITNLITDTRAYNRYYGWYSGDVSGFIPFVDGLHTKNPNLTFAISEYGAGASIYQHESNPSRPVTTEFFHPEEYQLVVHEYHWRAILQRPFIWGSFIWNMFDFAVSTRNEGDHDGRNDKGLVTYDRVTRKDSFYFYKANWSPKPFVYITSRRYTIRTTASTQVKVYSNTRSVTFYLNGQAVGMITNPELGIFLMNVELRAGENEIVAVADDLKDTVKWTLSNILINCGGRMPYTDKQGQIYDVDHYYSSKSVVVITPAKIEKTVDQYIYQSFRMGPEFSYHVPATSGKYTLHLKFVETEFDKEEQRFIDVFVNDKQVLSQLDIFKTAGGKNIALSVAIPSVKIGEYLDLRVQSKTQAILSGFILTQDAARA